MKRKGLRPDELQEHVFSSYIHLRYGAAIIAALLPVVLYAVGKAHNVDLPSSISDYYWASNPSGGFPFSRDYLVGGLFAVAAILYLYKGFSKAENIALNLAALLAVGVALFPTPVVANEKVGFTFHGFCAVSMFACLVFVVWFCSSDTLPLLSPAARRHYRQLYGSVGGVMLLSPLTAYIVNAVNGSESYVFFIEVAGIWAFAAYWLIKGSELKKSHATRSALVGKLAIAPQLAAVPALPGAAPPAGEMTA
jgi:hypothetical protein